MSMIITCLSSCDLLKSGIQNESPNNNDDVVVELPDNDSVDNEAKNSYYIPTAAVMTEEIDGEKNLILTWSFFFNEQNILSQLIAFVDNSEEVIIDLTYNGQGNLIKEAYTYSDGYKHIFDYTYDENGNCIKEVYTDQDNNSSTTVYDYTQDKNGNIVKKVCTVSDDYTTIYDYIYDENGNIVKEIFTGPNGDSIYEYIYDENNDCIKKFTPTKKTIVTRPHMTTLAMKTAILLR